MSANGVARQCKLVGGNLQFKLSLRNDVQSSNMLAKVSAPSFPRVLSALQVAMRDV